VRFTKGVFSDLAIWMIVLGVFFGAMFPLFVVWMDVTADRLFSWQFVGASMAAGFVIAIANWVLTRNVVAPRLVVRKDRMEHVEAGLTSLARGDEVGAGAQGDCLIDVDSNDEFGEGARAFNRLVGLLFQSLRSEAAVRSFTATLAARLELDELAGPALKQLLSHTGSDAGALLIEDEGKLRLLATFGLTHDARLLDSDHVRRAAREQVGHSLVTPDDVRLDGVVSSVRPAEVLVEPITHNRVPLGVVVLASTRAYPDEARSRLKLYLQGLGLALNNALAHDRLQRLAAIDPLTGAYNRRFGLARLREELGRSRRSNAPLGALMLDVDHFKSVNDTYGHLVGDRVLTSIVRCIRTILREGDVLIRYGGEEFLVLLPAAAKADVSRIAERMRRIVEETPVHEGDQEIHVTISLGGTSYPELDVADDEALISRADQAMYAAKQAGRNRVVV
jgi:diguanylate cyclase (GGDEF)-like protein